MVGGALALLWAVAFVLTVGGDRFALMMFNNLKPHTHKHKHRIYA